MNETQRNAEAFNADARADQLRGQLATTDRVAIGLMAENRDLRSALRDAMQLIPATVIAASPAVAAWYAEKQKLLART